MNAYYRAVADRANHRCEYCSAPEAIMNFRFEVEHIVPPKKGGDDSYDNLALACRSCNSHKSNRLEAIDEETKLMTRFFNPRTDTWTQHFQVDLQSGAIAGITPIGRVTSECLQFNSEPQRFARKHWMRLRLFP